MAGRDCRCGQLHTHSLALHWGVRIRGREQRCRSVRYRTEGTRDMNAAEKRFSERSPEATKGFDSPFAECIGTRQKE